MAGFAIFSWLALALLLSPIYFLVRSNRAKRRADELEARLSALERSHAAMEASLRRAHAALAELQDAAHPAAMTSAAVTSAAVTSAAVTSAAVTSAAAAAVELAVPPSHTLPSATQPVAAATSSATHTPPVTESSEAAAHSSQPTNAVPAPSPERAPTQPSAPSSEPTDVSPAFDWERWIGVRGAAVLGGVVLALAAISFFRYAVEHGLLPPVVRVALGTLLGVGSVLGAERLRARYGVTANALAGAGLVALYAAFWAARVSYELIGMEVAFGLMVLTTVTGCLLAVRHGSLLLALLVLVGGFATPLLLSSGSDRPIGLFGYILLLDGGLVWVARRRGWGVVFGLALAGTLLIEGLWLGLRMGPERAVFGMGVVAAFTALFVLAGARPPGDTKDADARDGWRQARLSAVLFSFGFALYFAAQARLGVRLAPLAVLLGILSFGAGWVARREPRARWLPFAAAAAQTAVVGVWTHSTPLTLTSSWETALASIGLGALFQLQAQRSGERSESFEAATIAQLGLLANLLAAALLAGVARIEVWLCGALPLLGMLALTGRRVWLGAPMIGAGASLAIALVAFQGVHSADPALAGRLRFFELELTIALALSVLSLVRRTRADHRLAAAFPGALLLGLSLTGPLYGFAGTTASLAFLAGLGVLTLFALTRAGDARWFAPAAAVLILAQHRAHVETEGSPLLPLAQLLLTLAFVAGWPPAVLPALRHGKWAVYVSVLAGPLWFLDLREAWVRAFGSAFIGVLPVALGALSLSLLWLSGRSPALALAPELRRTAIAGYAALALGFASVAIPLQLDRQWITLGWAIEAAALLVLFRRLDHAGLKWFALALAAAVTVRLVLNPSVLDYEERGWPILNWLLYTYWVPALALLGAHLALRDVELERIRPWEAGIYARRQPLLALALGMAVIAILFVWLNLAIFDAFAEGSRLAIDFERKPLRDLTISLGWAAYAGLLSAVGMMKHSRGLRWVSLAIWLLTTGKVFLYDLAHLRDLYRVLSLLGLAVSLLAISLAYQRFVFNGRARKGSA